MNTPRGWLSFIRSILDLLTEYRIHRRTTPHGGDIWQVEKK